MASEQNGDAASTPPQPAKRERRKLQAASAPLSKEVIVAACLKTALAAEPGSVGALEAAQEAIFLSVTEVMQTLQPALAPLLSTEGKLDAAAMRKSWIAKIRFLNGCLAFPELQDLSVALQELDRGVTAGALRAQGDMQGGKSGTERLRLMAYAVEAADELKRRCSKDAEYRAELKASESSYATIDKYRKAIRNVPEFAPRLGWHLYWQEAPEIVLQHVAWAIKMLDKNK